jgi:hypothetical protein
MVRQRQGKLTTLFVMRLHQAKQLLALVNLNYTSLVTSFVVHKNKPLSSSSQPNLALNARYTSLFFQVGAFENFKTCRGPYLDLDLYIHVNLSGDPVPLRFGDFWKSSIQYACVLCLLNFSMLF